MKALMPQRLGMLFKFTAGCAIRNIHATAMLRIKQLSQCQQIASGAHTASDQPLGNNSSDQSLLAQYLLYRI